MAYRRAQTSVLLAWLTCAVVFGSAERQRFSSPVRDVNRPGLIKRMPQPATLSRRSQAELDTSNFIDVVSVEKRPTSQGTRFTLNLRKNTDKEVTALFYNYDHSSQETELITQDAENMVSTTFVIRASSERGDRVYVLLSDGTYDSLMAILLNNTASNETVTQQLPDQAPIISITSAPEAVFEWGQNVTVSAAITVPGQRAVMSNTNMNPYFYGVDLSTGEYHQYFEEEDFMTPMEPTFHGDTARGSAEIHTGLFPVSGYLQVSSTVDPGDDTVVFSIYLARHVLIRPSNQSGAFPPGYLSIVNDFYQEFSGNGNTLLRCQVGRTCRSFCEAVGEFVSDIQVFQVEADGSLVKANDVTVAEAPSPSGKSIFWSFTAEEDSGDENGITTFECRAYGSGRGANRQMVNKRYDMQVQIPAAIDADMSIVTYTPDPESNMRYILTFHCTVAGRPIPEVTFTIRTSQDDYFPRQARDYVLQTSPTSGVATKTVTVNISDFNHVVTQMENGYFSWPTCTAYSPDIYDPVTYDFILHQIP